MRTRFTCFEKRGIRSLQTLHATNTKIGRCVEFCFYQKLFEFWQHLKICLLEARTSEVKYRRKRSHDDKRFCVFFSLRI